MEYLTHTFENLINSGQLVKINIFINFMLTSQNKYKIYGLIYIYCIIPDYYIMKI